MGTWSGIGVDLVKVERVAKISPAARARLFTPQELACCVGSPERVAERLAGRFAAKEAVLKAFGTGLAGGIRWQDIEVVVGAQGNPSVVLHGKALELAEQKQVRQVLLSISHDAGLAIAMVALQT